MIGISGAVIVGLAIFLLIIQGVGRREEEVIVDQNETANPQTEENNWI